MTHHTAFIEHPALTRFAPHLQSYARKGLQELKNGGKQFKATAIETYAASVFERVGEIDNSVKSLRLALGFILELRSSHQEASDIYRYHYENLLLRVTGIVDRAYLLVGTSLSLSHSRLERNGAIKFVNASVSSRHPELLEPLQELVALAATRRTARNEVAHSKAFSTRELGLLSAVSSLRIEVDNKDEFNELMDAYFSQSSEDLALLVANMVTGIEVLLHALKPIYEHLYTENV